MCIPFDYWISRHFPFPIKIFIRYIQTFSHLSKKNPNNLIPSVFSTSSGNHMRTNCSKCQIEKVISVKLCILFNQRCNWRCLCLDAENLDSFNLFELCKIELGPESIIRWTTNFRSTANRVTHSMAIILTSPNCIVHQLLFTLRRVLVRPSGSSLDTTTLFIRHNSRTNNCLGNFYDTLDVPSNATQSEIKNSYYKLSMLYHPDRNKDSDKALARFREITDAYDVLCNPRTRRAYDEGTNLWSWSNSCVL